MKVVIFTDPIAGGMSIFYPSYKNTNRPVGETDDEYLTRSATKAIPDGINTHTIEADTLPTDRYFRNAWTWSD
jgi:hypothetical protein